MMHCYKTFLAMGHYQPTDLYWFQHKMATKIAEMYEEEGKEDKAKECRQSADKIWKKREEVMNKKRDD